jgi:acyl transferase domain-containing protein
VVLEEAPFKEDSGPSRPWQLLLLSAKTITALDKSTTNLIKHLKQHPHLKLEDVAYTLQIGRRAFNHRRMVVCKNLDDAVGSLETLDSRRVSTSIQVPMKPEVVFMFSGQGAQYVNMGLELYRTEPEFQEQVDRCSKMLLPHLAFDLRDVLYPGGGNVEEAAQKLGKTFITQPALFTIEYALAKLWMSWGVNPAALVGHSIGEYVAACLAGVFSLEDALSLIATRGRLMQGLREGSMLAVSLPEGEVRLFLDDGLSLGAINSPSFCVVSGEKEAIESLQEELSKKSLDFRLLHTSHAFHSAMMEPILESFAGKVKQVRLNPPQIPIASNLTGTWITSDEATDPSYWARHLRMTVRFSNCVQELLKGPNRVFLEVGPGQTLTTFVRQHSDGSKGRIVLSSTRHPKDRESDVPFILNTLGRVWLAGIHVDWGKFYKSERRHRVPLPTYPFKRQRFWLEPGDQSRGYSASQAGLGKTENNHQGSTELELVDSPIFEDLDLKNNYVAPRNEVEKIIAEIWKQMLGINQVGIFDNFIELGGDSLLATRVIVRIREMLRVELSVEQFFEAPTIIDLSMGVEEILIKEIEELPEDEAQRRVQSLG